MSHKEECGLKEQMRTVVKIIFAISIAAFCTGFALIGESVAGQVMVAGQIGFIVSGIIMTLTFLI